MDIVEKVLETSIKLEDKYRIFWKKIYKNDAYIFLKNAIEFYKNIQNHNFHEFYSGIINKRLYTGRCIVAPDYILKSFNEQNNTTSDEICKLTLQIINILDNVFEYAPRLPFETITYRFLTLPNDDLLLHLEEGDFYRELGINSISLNPFYSGVNMWGFKDDHNIKLQKRVFLTIILPENTKCYYMNIPFTFNKDKWFLNEFEIVLPRDCIYMITSKKIYHERYFYTLKLIYQVPVSERQIINIEEVLPSRQPKESDIKTWNIKIDKTKCNQKECDWMYYLAEKGYKLWNKLPENQKYEPNNEEYVDIKPKKIWLYITYYDWNTKDLDKNFKKLLKKNKNIKLKIENKTIHTNKKYLYLENELMGGGNYNYETNNKNTNICKNKFYETSKTTPLLYLVEINIKKKLNAKKLFLFQYKLDKIKVKVKDIKYINLMDKYNYGLVTAEMI